MTSIPDRVAAGATYLDEHVPGWLDKVSVNSLEMAHPCRCVLGQVFGPAENYWLASRRMFSDGALDLGVDDLAASYGFDVELKDGDGFAEVAEFEALEREWVRLIEERRAAVSA